MDKAAIEQFLHAQVQAWNAECPHLGCKVGYDKGDKRFGCPCHDSAFSPEGKEIVFTSIYSIEGDTLRYCTGAGRPKEFVSKEGDGFMNSVWKRKKQ